MKKTICLVTNWYPTRENPIKGCFFKEQIFALENSCDFVVFRYQERVKKVPFKRDCLSIYNREKNSIEYSAIAYIPVWIYICDFMHTFWIKHFHPDRIMDGIGKYCSGAGKAIRKKKILKLFRKTKVKVDAFYCIDGQKEAFNTLCLASHYKKPYIVSEHAPVPWPGTLIADCNKMAIERADAFFAISNDKIRQLMLQNIKLPKTIHLGNMVDETKFTILNKTKPKTKTFIIVAANSYYKNLDMFINVFNRLCEITEKEFRVLIVGYGANKGYSKNVEEFEDKIRNGVFSSKAELIREVPRDEMNDMYNRADAFVMTSIQEGQPVSALEAACCGLPVFSTRCGGVEDYVGDDIGMIFDIADSEGMAQGLKCFLEGKKKYDSVVIRSKTIQRFGRTAFIERFVSAFDKLCR